MPSPPPFVGGEIFVNSATAGSQSAPTAARLAGGHYVVAWTDGSHKIFARFLDSDGTPLGGDIAVSMGSNVGRSSVVALTGGGFLIGWDDYDGVGGLDVRAQVFASDGARVGSEFVINTTLAGSQSTLDLTQLADGRILATWIDSGQPNSAKAQLFAADGARIGTEFQATPTDASYSSPSVAALSGGGFAISYTRLGANPNIQVQIFDSSGAPVGSPVPVGFDATGYHIESAIAALPGDGFVVTWESFSHPAHPDNLIEVDAQVFAADGSPVTGVFAVNPEPTEANPYRLTVQSFADGRFLIIWADFSGSLGDDDFGAIYGQFYDAGGGQIDVPFRINTQTVNSQYEPAITATDANGVFLVAWTDSGPSLGIDIKGQLIGLPTPMLFDDAPNNVDFNAVAPGDFPGPFTSALAGNDVVILPDDSGTLAAWGIAGGFTGGDGNDILTEGAAYVPLLGGAGNDILTGNSGHDMLAGEDGNDTLSGLGGGDELIGGDGDDTYVIVSASDTIVENSGEGRDTVQTALSVYVLRDFVENLTFTGTGTFVGVGNALDNVITSSPDTASELVGGDGDDTYVIFMATDTIVEYADAGNDTVRTALTVYRLRDHLEDLIYTGSSSFVGVGNSADNRISGGTGAASELQGGAGDDTYLVSVIGDTIVEQGGGGIDTVRTTLSVYRLTANNVENLTYAGTGRFTGLGNALDNVISAGDADDDYLYAGAGVDTLMGGDGADVFLFDEAVNGVDLLSDFAPGSDRIFLNHLVFAHTATVNLVQGSGALAATNGNSTIFYHDDTGQIGYDADGTGAGAEIIFAAITPGAVLHLGDFVFY